MKRFRDHLDAEGLAEKKVGTRLGTSSFSSLTEQSKTTNKRLSIEGAKPKTHTPTSHTPIPQQNAISPPIDPSPTPRAKPTQAEEDAYEVQRIDVTEEVNRRLRESRLRRLMETPTTSHKRKYDAYEEPRSGSTIGRDDEADSRGWSGSEYERTPTKRIKCSGTFEQLGKRKENGSADTGSSGKHDNRTNIKRRRV